MIHRWEGCNCFSVSTMVKNISIREFIEEVKLRRLLWDSSNSSYNNFSEVTESWEEIGRIFNLPGSHMKCEWKNLLNIFTRVQRAQMSGQSTNDNYVIKWPYFNALSFLNETTEFTPDYTSVPQDDSSFLNPIDIDQEDPKDEVGSKDTENIGGLLMSNTSEATAQEDVFGSDSDIKFLCSLYHRLKKIPPKEKAMIQILIMKIICEAAYGFRKP